MTWRDCACVRVRAVRITPSTMPFSPEEKARRRAAAAIAAGRKPGVVGRPKDSDMQSAGHGSVMAADIDAGTSAAPEERWAAHRNAAKRAKRLHASTSSGEGEAEQESQHAVQAGESSRQQDDLDEAAIATNPESNLLEPLRARGFAGGRRSLYAPTAVDGRPRGYEPKVPSGFSDSNGGFACCGDVHCNVCAEKRS